MANETSPTPALELTGIDMHYGYVRALAGIDFHVLPGEVVGLLGDNGAGKSTLLKVICGLLPPRRGSVVFDGADLAGLRADQVLQRGICYVPQDRSLFPDMTVRENLRMGGYILKDRAEVDRRDRKSVV